MPVSETDSKKNLQTPPETLRHDYTPLKKSDISEERNDALLEKSFPAETNFDDILSPSQKKWQSKHKKLKKLAKKRKFKSHLIPEVGPDGEVFNPKAEDMLSVLMPGSKYERIKKVFQLTIRYNGDLHKAIEEVGYGSVVHKNPNVITKSKTWGQLMKYYFPPILLAEKNMEMLQHEDWRAVNAALERLHKLRGDFTTKIDVHVSAGADLSTKSDAELNRIIEGEATVVRSFDSEGNPITDGTVEEDPEREGADGMAGEGADREGEEGTV